MCVRVLRVLEGAGAAGHHPLDHARENTPPIHTQPKRNRPIHTQDEFTWYMEDAGTRLLLLPAGGNANAAAAAASLKIAVATIALDPKTLVLAVADAAAGASTQPLTSAAAAAAAGDAAAPTPEPLPSDVALFLHTSGTTSKPKGVPLTHANIAASLANIVATYELAPTDVSYMVMPLFHVHGLMAGTFAPLAAGGAVILPVAGRFSASVFWEDCVEHGATFYTAVPTMHQVRRTIRLLLYLLSCGLLLGWLSHRHTTSSHLSFHLATFPQPTTHPTINRPQITYPPPPK